MKNFKTSGTHRLSIANVKSYEQQLDDVMEITSASLVKQKLSETEKEFEKNPGELNKTRLGIIYHEVALNLTFLDKTGFKGYAKKSYDLLTGLFNNHDTAGELIPFIASYRASALSLVCSETKKLKLLGDAFRLFEAAINEYADVSPYPEFLRGSVAENLPFLFFSKRKFAKKDFQSIIKKQEANPGYANSKVLSFSYLVLAKQYRSKKFRDKTIEYLDKSIALDPDYKAGRKMAEKLKLKLINPV